jgi:catechol 2,3-dioxygenase-like lactoylglutathione lyase family enzyme
MKFSPKSICLAALAVVAAAATPVSAAAKAFIAVSVRDVQASADWYARTFDLRQVGAYSAETYDQRILAGEELIVELVQRKPAGGKAPDTALGFTKGGLRVERFDERVTRWRAQGVNLPGGGKIAFDAGLGLHMTVLEDPDGNYIQVYGVSQSAPAQQ